MYHLIKKNQKKLLAVFGVLLMVVFIIPPAAKYGSTRANVVVAHTGKTPIYQADMSAAKEEWGWLNRQPGRGQPGMVFFSEILRDNPVARNDQMMQFGAFQTGRAIAENINDHPEMFLLLQREAAANGLQVSTDEANEYLKNVLGQPVGTDESDRFRTKAVQDLLTVAAQLRYLAASAKISQPVWQHEVAMEQSVRLNLVDFRAGDYARSVPAPTTQQVQQQFDAYKNFPPHHRGTDDPLGFGYQVPARVKLQYLSIPHAQVVDAVIHSVRPTGAVVGPSDTSVDAAYEWDVQAALYYDKHSDEFKNAKPAATQPTRGPATQPASQPASEPAVKPFEQVKRQIVEKLVATQVDQQTAKIVDELSSKLAADYRAIRDADPSAVKPAADEPTTAPATSRPAPELTTLAHLEEIRSAIDQKYHVPVEIHDIVNDWQTSEALRKLPGIGAASTHEHEPFAEYATSFSAGEHSAIEVWQPSTALTDAANNTYLFRLTAAQAAHAPRDLAPIAAQVEQDWRTAQAYELAKKDAKKTYDSARSVGLAQAARTIGQNVTSTPLFPPRGVQQVPGYPPLDPASARELLAASESLIRAATSSDPHPDTLVELPSAQRVAVLELAAVQLPYPEWQAQFMTAKVEQQTRMQRLAEEWFKYDAVVARNGYKAEEKS